jgi:hypothetical protein
MKTTPDSGAARTPCNWLSLLFSAVLLLVVSVFLFDPSAGNATFREIKAIVAQSPLALVLGAFFFVVCLVYWLWCFGLVPNRLHPAQAGASRCKILTVYLAVASLAAFLGGLLAWGVALITSRYAAFGVLLLAAGVPPALIISYVFRGIRRSMDEQVQPPSGVGTTD